MKKIIFAFACALAFSTAASAQFTSSKKSASAGEIPGKSISVSYGFASLSSDGSSISGSEVALGFAMPFAVSSTTPLFVELAPEVSYMDVEEWKKVTVAVPVSIGYAFAVENFMLAPYAGVSAKLNPMMKEGDYNLIGSDRPGKIFQGGFQVGVKAYISKFNFGLSYNGDISPVAKIDGLDAKFNTSAFRISVGFNF